MSTCKCGQPSFNCNCTFAVQEPFTYQDRLNLERENTRLKELAYICVHHDTADGLCHSCAEKIESITGVISLKDGK